ncbi:MAG: hypothetical protein BAJALOKI2v1_620007 [Promethearchaeota archaeon]|nr:MAG: hypothetical protein BAJALOKI2v1_620007 [Candidatus Lokiarchaeota archaeon]
MDKDKIVGALYLKFNSLEGPNPVLSSPEDLSETIITSVPKKVIEYLSAQTAKVSKSIEKLDFPSVNLKGFFKYKRWEDTVNPRGYTRTALILLFPEKANKTFEERSKEIEKEIDNFLFDIIGLEHKSAERKQYIKILKKFKKKIAKL